MLKKKVVPLAMAASMLLALPAAGAEDIQEFELDPVMVTAQRRETKDLDTPASATVITQEQIERTGAKTVFDALENTVGFSSNAYGVGGMDYGGSQSRNLIRGLDKGTLVLVNGAPLNLLNYSGTNSIPIEAVERIEIIKGASSTLYGAEALAGVVNIITKKPGAGTGSTITTAVGNYQNSVSLSTQFDNNLLVISRDWFDNRGEGSRPNILPSNNMLYGYDSSARDNIYFASQVNDRLSFSASVVRQDPSMYTHHRLTGVPTTRYNFEDRRHNVNMIYNDEENGFKSILAFTDRRLRSTSTTLSNGSIKLSTTYDLYSLTSDTQKVWDIGANDKLIAGLMVGTEHYGDPSANDENALRNRVAGYLSYERNFSDKFSVTLGSRIEHIADYAKDETPFMPQIQTLYKINDKASWFINIGKSFQMAPLNQYFSTGSQFSMLKPQQGWTYETGLKFIDAKNAWKLSFYHMDIKDKYDWRGPTEDRYIANVGDFRNTGIEIEYTRILNDNWRVNAGLSLSNPEINDNNTGWVQDSSRVQGIAGISYDKNKFSANVNYLFVGDRENSYYRMVGNSDFLPLDSRHHLNANFSYKPDKKNTITLSMNNLLDRKNSLNMYERLDLPFNWMLSYTRSF